MVSPETTFAVITAPKRESAHWKAGTVTWGEMLGWAESPASEKECGNYLLGTIEPTEEVHKRSDGPCRGMHRNKRAIVSRGALQLDVDKGRPGLAERLELILGCAALVHTTYSSSPDDLRYRIVIPLDREVAPDEYHHIAEVVMDWVGRDMFDRTTSQPERYMFRPAARQLEWYQRWVLEGDPLDTAQALANWDPDLSRLADPKPSKNKRDPKSLDGVIGAFNRVYTIDQVIEAYDIPYTRVSEGRWSYAGGKGEAGLHEIDEGLVYSHHGTDPASGKTCSAFDLARLHLFGEQDEGVKPDTPVNRLPSNIAMMELANIDPKVTRELVGGDFIEGEDEAWLFNLRTNARTGALKDEVHNWDLIRDNDPVFKALVFDEFSMAVETTADLPWRPMDRGGSVFTLVDRNQLMFEIERRYRFRPPVGLVDQLVSTAAQKRFRNPVRDYLDALEWDGTPRLETCLPAEDTPHNRMVARKCLVAAVARVYEPGCKWDHTLVLQGDEGLGKSWWIEKMSNGWTSSLGRIGDKDTLINMQRSWIVVADEGHSFKKAESDALKEFLTRTEDMFRMPYDRETVVHKRHCVIWSTINDETFLRREEGNRRFLTVRVEQQPDFGAMTPEWVAQVWAEAKALYLKGERLYLTTEESAVAAGSREQYVEEDSLMGLIREYVDMPVPADWVTRSAESRMSWRQSWLDGFVPDGPARTNRICSTQVWVEVLGRRIGDHRRVDLLEITNLLKRMPGWRILPGRVRLPGYGPQLVFERTDTKNDPFAELI